MGGAVNLSNQAHEGNGMDRLRGSRPSLYSRIFLWARIGHSREHFEKRHEEVNHGGLKEKGEAVGASTSRSL